MYYNAPKTGRPGSKSKFTSRYLDAPVEPLYPFGFGLSYTSFAWSDMKVKENTDTLEVTVTLENTGDRRGSEVVQLYMHDVAASLVRPKKELKGFCKVTLDSGEKRDVTVSMEKAQMGFYDDDMNYWLEDGKFILYVGGNSRDCLSETVDVKF